MHLYHHPQDAREEIFCLTPFPKKIEEKLQVPNDADAKSGWGLHYVEGMNWPKTHGAGLMACLSSLIFEIVWTKLKDDVQGGFQVSAFMLAILTSAAGLPLTTE